MSERTLTLKRDTIPNATPERLETLAHMARAGGNRAMRKSVERRAIELERPDLIPADWDAPIPEPAKPRAAPWPVQLDAPAEDVLDDHAMLDRVTRALSATLAVDYLTGLEKLQQAVKAGRELMGRDVTLTGVLRRAGVKELAMFESDVKTLGHRDDLVARELDAALAPAKAQEVDPQGRVILAESFDVPHLLHEDEARERRWRAARELDPRGYADRAVFELEDELYLNGGRDLVATLERPATVAGAQRHASEVAGKLDQIISLEQDRTRRTRMLDQAIAELASERDNANRKPGDGKTLDADGPVTFATLPAAKMDAALAVYKQRNTASYTLDDAAAEVSQNTDDVIPMAGPRHGSIPGLGDRHELDSQIRAHQKATGASFPDAFRHVTGVDIGAHPGA